MMGYTTMALNPLNGSNLEHLALKGLNGAYSFQFCTLAILAMKTAFPCIPWCNGHCS